MNYSKLVCVSIVILCLSCTQKKSDIGQEQPKSTTTESELLSTYFNKTELQSLSHILNSFEQGVCKDLSSKEIKRCYELHFQSLKSDFFQGNPVHLNFPYDGGMSLREFKDETILLSIWNDLCLMGNQELDLKIEYYCLNPNGPFIDYFKSWSSATSIYKHIIDRIENETLSINQPKELFLVPNEFDFSKVDDRVIYSILHMTLSEEYRALDPET